MVVKIKVVDCLLMVCLRVVCVLSEQLLYLDILDQHHGVEFALSRCQ
jgi:hypothetical protein